MSVIPCRPPGNYRSNRICSVFNAFSFSVKISHGSDIEDKVVPFGVFSRLVVESKLDVECSVKIYFVIVLIFAGVYDVKLFIQKSFAIRTNFIVIHTREIRAVSVRIRRNVKQLLFFAARTCTCFFARFGAGCLFGYNRLAVGMSVGVERQSLFNNFFAVFTSVSDHTFFQAGGSHGFRGSPQNVRFGVNRQFFFCFSTAIEAETETFTLFVTSGLFFCRPLAVISRVSVCVRRDVFGNRFAAHRANSLFFACRNAGCPLLHRPNIIMFAGCGQSALRLITAHRAYSLFLAFGTASRLGFGGPHVIMLAGCRYFFLCFCSARTGFFFQPFFAARSLPHDCPFAVVMHVFALRFASGCRNRKNHAGGK